MPLEISETIDLPHSKTNHAHVIIHNGDVRNQTAVIDTGDLKSLLGWAYGNN